MRSLTEGIVSAMILLTLVGSSLAFLPPPIFASDSTTSTSPIWAFNGSYATYSYGFNYNGSPVTVQATVTLSNVNPSTRTYDYANTCSGSYCTIIESSGGFPNGTNSFDSSYFPAVNASELNSLNEGRSTDGMTGSITPNTTVTVPAGTITVDKVTVSGGTLWVDTESGLYVRLFITSHPDIQGVSGDVDVQLFATNIPTAASGNLSFAVLIVALVVVAASVVSVVDYSALKGVRKASDAHQEKSEADEVNNAPALEQSFRW